MYPRRRTTPVNDFALISFRSSLTTYDSLLLLRSMIGKSRGKNIKSAPGVLATTDPKKAFDTVSHAFNIAILNEHDIGHRLTSVVKHFLCNRTFETYACKEHCHISQNQRGVPRALFCLQLSNLVMSKIAKELRQIPHIQSSISADDITISIDPRKADRTTASSRAYTSCTRYSRHHPPTHWDAAHNNRRTTTLFQFERSQLKLPPERWVKILGIPVPEDGGCSARLEQIKASTASRKTRVGRATMETFHPGCPHGEVCFDFVQIQLQQLEE